MAKIIAVGIQKGGVGKTTIACNLAMAAVKVGYRTALIDLDSQGNASVALSGNRNLKNIKESGSQQIYEEDNPIFTETESGVYLLHGHSRLSEIDHRDNVDEESVQLREKVKNLPFDFVIIDTPPAENARHLAPLFWADLLLAPLRPDEPSVSGLGDSLSLIKGARRKNPGLEFRIVINQVTSSSKEQKKIIKELYEALPGDSIMKVLKYRVAVTDMLALGLPVWAYKKDQKLGQDWNDFCNDVLNLVK